MIRYLPGFRSGNKIKMCIALLYYMYSIFFGICEMGEPLAVLMFISIPIVSINWISYLKTSWKGYKTASVFGAAMFLVFIVSVIFSEATFSFNADEFKNGVSAMSSNQKQNDTVLIFNSIAEQENKNAIGVLNECGVTEIKSAKYDSSLDWEGLKGYRLSTELDNVGEVIAYFDHEKIRQVRFLGEYLYKSGEVIGLATDMFLTSSQGSDYQIRCKKVVESILKSPSTAKFPSITKWNIGKFDGKVIVQSYVDSQNSFGAMLRSEFQFIIENDKVTSFIFDGQEMIK